MTGIVPVAFFIQATLPPESGPGRHGRAGVFLIDTY